MEWRIESMYGDFMALSFPVLVALEVEKAKSLWFTWNWTPSSSGGIFLYSSRQPSHRDRCKYVYTWAPWPRALRPYICIFPSKGAFFPKFCFDADVAPSRAVSWLVSSSRQKAKGGISCSVSHRLFPSLSSHCYNVGDMCVWVGGGWLFSPRSSFCRFFAFSL